MASNMDGLVSRRVTARSFENGLPLGVWPVACLMCCLSCLSRVDAQAVNGTSLSRYQRADGSIELYIAVDDPLLVKAFELLDKSWSELATERIYLTRGHLDRYLPIELRSMGHLAADAMEARIAEYLFAQRTVANLVPNSIAMKDGINGVAMADKQMLRLPFLMAELLRWFPKRPAYRAAVASIARATIKHMFEGGGAVRPMAVVDGGAADPAWITATMSLGWSAEGIAELARITGDPFFMRAVDQKLDWVWAHRPNPSLPLLQEHFTQSHNVYMDCPTQTVLCARQTSDTDTLYYVRSLFALWYKLRDAPGLASLAQKYKRQALAVTDFWFSHAWIPEYELFVRKMAFDGSIGERRFHSDGIYNLLHILIWAYKATQDSKYIERLDQTYRSMLRRSRHVPVGLIDNVFVEGVGQAQMTPGQHIILDALVEAYLATRDRSWLSRAKRLSLALLEEGNRSWGGSANDYYAGAVFLRCALTLQRIQRVEVDLGPHQQTLTVRRGDAGGQVVLRLLDLSARHLVLFVPSDRYEFSVDDSTPGRRVDPGTSARVRF